MKYVVRHVMESCPEDIGFFTSFVDKELKERLERLVSEVARPSWNPAHGGSRGGRRRAHIS